MAAGDTKLPSSWTQRLAQPFSIHRTPLDTIRHHWTQKTFPARAQVRQRDKGGSPHTQFPSPFSKEFKGKSCGTRLRYNVSKVARRLPLFIFAPPRFQQGSNKV